MNYLKIFLIALPIFLLLDALWLGLVARGLYQKNIGFLLGPVNWTVALIFYLIFVAALVFLVIHPAIVARAPVQLLVSALVFGLATYAAYDLTNLATINNWPLSISLIDIAWGMFISAATSISTYYIFINFFA